jgi:phosphatidylserine decarboxylase
LQDSIISSPADCRLTAFPTISLAKKFWIKGYGFTIPKLLASNSLAPSFENGSLLIARLAPQDYHRWHSPVDGVIESITEIPGCYYTVNPQAINESGTLDVFCENRRSVMIVRPNSNPDSKVAIIAVGAMLVGSILYNPGISPGREIRRGECLGAFRYGGSTVIVLFPRGEVVLDEDLVRNSTGGGVGGGGDDAGDGQSGDGGEDGKGGEGACETLVKVGWRVGIRSRSDQGGSQNQN